MNLLKSVKTLFILCANVIGLDTLKKLELFLKLIVFFSDLFSFVYSSESFSL